MLLANNQEEMEKKKGRQIVVVTYLKSALFFKSISMQ